MSIFCGRLSVYVCRTVDPYCPLMSGSTVAHAVNATETDYLDARKILVCCILLTNRLSNYFMNYCPVVLYPK